MSNVLPFEFDEIINYSNITNAQSSSFVGYTYNAKTNSIKLDISNADDVNNQSEEDELVNAIINANKHEKDINQLKSKIKQLEKQSERLQSKVNQDKINANNTPIVAGSSGATGIDHKGVYSHEIDNPNNMVRLQNGVLGISKNGDKEFVPIITPEGINPRFLQTPIKTTKQKDAVDDNVVKNNIVGVGSNGNNGSGGTGTGNNITNVTNVTNNIVNPKIQYIDLPCKIIRDPSTKKVVRIEYYRNGNLEYVDKLTRDSSTSKVNKIVTEHIGKETETTSIVRDTTTGMVTNIDVSYINLDATLEYAGMK